MAPKKNAGEMGAGMVADKRAVTPAIRVLRESGVPFDTLTYRYEEHGGTRVAARELGVDEHAVIKTLVFEDERGTPLLVLMHGDREVSAKSLARTLGVKAVRPCDPLAVRKHTGYSVGGVSPFGMRKPLPVCMEDSILSCPSILVNGGKRGLMVLMSPQDLAGILHPRMVQVAR